MKNRLTMKYITIMLGILSFILMLEGCDTPQIGNLETDNAAYLVDSIVIKAQLDPIMDATKIKNQVPWQSNSIEGVIGTFPIHYYIVSIEGTGDFDLEYALQTLYVRNDGTIVIPIDHKFAPGRYILTLEIRNIWGSVVKENIFTIIVQ